MPAQEAGLFRLAVGELAWEALIALSQHAAAATANAITLELTRHVDPAEIRGHGVSVLRSHGRPAPVYRDGTSATHRLRDTLRALTGGVVVRLTAEGTEIQAPPALAGPLAADAQRALDATAPYYLDGEPLTTWLDDVFLRPARPANGGEAAQAATIADAELWPWRLQVHAGPDSWTDVALTLGIHPLTIDETTQQTYHLITARLLVLDGALLNEWDEALRDAVWTNLLDAVGPDEHWRRLRESRQALALLLDGTGKASTTLLDIARDEIRRGQEDGQPTRDECLALAEETRRELVELSASVNATPATWEREGMLWLDALAVETLERIGEAPEQVADVRAARVASWLAFTGEQPWLPGAGDTQRAARDDVWRLWLRNDSHYTRFFFAHTLANALWHARVKNRAATAVPPSISLPLFTALEEALWAHGREVLGPVIDVPSTRFEIGRAGTALRGGTFNPVVETTTPTLAADVLDKIVRKTRTLHGMRTLLYVVREGHRLHLSGRGADIDIEGGWSGLAEAIGLDGTGKNTSEVRAAVQALQAFRFEGPAGEIGGLLLYAVSAPQPGRRARLRITPSPLLRPYYVTSPGYPARDKRLVPIPPSEAPLVGGQARTHAGQVQLQLRIGREFSERRAELQQYGHIEITPEHWRDLCDSYEIPRPLQERILETWCHQAPAILRRDGPNLYAPGPHWGPAALAMFRDAGNLAAAQSARAKRKQRR